MKSNNLFKKEKIVSLIVVLLMIASAAITVNHSLFGHSVESIREDSSVAVVQDSISNLPDGTIVIHTRSLSGTINGYAGAVPLDIYIKDGKVSDIQVLPNSETPSFLKRALPLLESWRGKEVGMALETEVDAVSGATYTSSAIISNVRAGLAMYEGEGNRTGKSVPVKIWIALGVTLCGCIVPLFVRSRYYHRAQMVANILVLGFWCGQFLDYYVILKCTSSGFLLPEGLIAIAMLTAAFIYPLFGHPQHYCTHICPLGSAQQLIAEICGFKLHLSQGLLKGLEWFRRILWGVLMLFLWTDALTGWMDLELFQAFQYKSASWGIIIAASVFILLSAIVTRPYCRFVCPTGSLFKRAENIG